MNRFIFRRTFESLRLIFERGKEIESSTDFVFQLDLYENSLYKFADNFLYSQISLVAKAKCC